jgi:hypothetical protein
MSRAVTILIVVFWRLVYRLTRGAPPDEPTLEPWQKVASHANHWGLYLLLVAAPVAGYVGISLFPALDIFGLVKLPGIVAPDKAAASAKGTVRPSAVPITRSRTTSFCVKWRSSCGGPGGMGHSPSRLGASDSVGCVLMSKRALAQKAQV